MSTSDNVIQLSDYKELKESKTRKVELTSSDCDVESISQIRKDMILDEKRKVKRTLLTEFIGASVILPGSGLVKVSLNDISVTGLSFDSLKKFGQYKKNEKVAIRIYLNHTTYFPLELQVSNVRFIKELGVYRHGAQFMKGSVNDEAIFHFIRFMETVNTSLKADKGDLMLSK